MGRLYIVTTPIGNLEDMTPRAIRVIYTTQTLLCEDTRQTGILLDLVSKRFPMLLPPGAQKPKLVRYDDQAERTMTPELIQKLTDGDSIALVSDAGTPLISDPGYVLVSECRKHGIPVISVPGASALLTALASSGLPADKFMFLGYPPEKQGHRITLFRSLININQQVRSTYILYCSPHKLFSTLTDMREVFGDIHIVVSRELTKIHEENWRGTISEPFVRFADPKGEIVLSFDLKM